MVKCIYILYIYISPRHGGNQTLPSEQKVEKKLCERASRFNCQSIEEKLMMEVCRDKHHIKST